MNNSVNARALVAEFVGTFTLIFAGVGAIAAGANLVGVALAHGLAIAVMVSATMAVSGGHLNPAVTLGLWLARKIDFLNALLYMVAQCLGGLVAAWVLLLLIPDQVHAVNVGTPALAPGLPVVSGLLIEAILTFFLVFVIYGTAVDARAHKVGGLFIGLTITLDILMGGPLTGAAMNPARHLGPALVSGQLLQTWLYWLGPLLGGAAAALLYRYVLEEAVSPRRDQVHPQA
ncbi:MAG TPA: MIP family channel protein [Trueperaceae bacterium]